MFKPLQEAVSDILFQDWDPIGVNDDPSAPRDEYKSYVGPIIEKLENEESNVSIALHLARTATKKMATEQDFTENLGVVRKLKRAYEDHQYMLS